MCTSAFVAGERTHLPGGEGGGGSIFWKRRDIGLASYSNNLSTVSLVKTANFAWIFVYRQCLTECPTWSFKVSYVYFNFVLFFSSPNKIASSWRTHPKWIKYNHGEQINNFFCKRNMYKYVKSIFDIKHRRSLHVFPPQCGFTMFLKWNPWSLCSLTRPATKIDIRIRPASSKICFSTVASIYNCKYLCKVACLQVASQLVLVKNLHKRYFIHARCITRCLGC